MKINDAVFGGLLMALALAILVNVQGFPSIPGQKIGPAAFPALLAVILAVCSVLLIIRGMRSGARWAEAGLWTRSPRHALRFAAIVGALLFYLAAADGLGFIPTAILMMIALLRVFGVAWPATLGTALVGTLAIHAIFYKLLKVPLPWGVLQGAAW